MTTERTAERAETGRRRDSRKRNSRKRDSRKRDRQEEPARRTGKSTPLVHR